MRGARGQAVPTETCKFKFAVLFSGSSGPARKRCCQRINKSNGSIIQPTVHSRQPQNQCNSQNLSIDLSKEVQYSVTRLTALRCDPIFVESASRSIYFRSKLPSGESTMSGISRRAKKKSKQENQNDKISQTTWWKNKSGGRPIQQNHPEKKASKKKMIKKHKSVPCDLSYRYSPIQATEPNRPINICL